MILIAITVEMIGTLLIGWAALRVHHRVLNEHKIDTKVFKSMKKEQWLGIIGIVMILVGYILQVLDIIKI